MPVQQTAGRSRLRLALVGTLPATRARRWPRPDDSLDRRQQLLQIERLRQRRYPKSIENRLMLMQRLNRRGAHDHGNRPRHRIEREQIQDRPPPLLSANRDVQDDQVRPHLPDKLVRRVPFLADADRIPLVRLEQIPHEIEKRRVIVDQSNPRRGHPPSVRDLPTPSLLRQEAYERKRQRRTRFELATPT